jgi:hypothetical protein
MVRAAVLWSVPRSGGDPRIAEATRAAAWLTGCVRLTDVPAAPFSQSMVRAAVLWSVPRSGGDPRIAEATRAAAWLTGCVRLTDVPAAPLGRFSRSCDGDGPRLRSKPSNIDSTASGGSLPTSVVGGCRVSKTKTNREVVPPSADDSHPRSVRLVERIARRARKGRRAGLGNGRSRNQSRLTRVWCAAIERPARHDLNRDYVARRDGPLSLLASCLQIGELAGRVSCGRDGRRATVPNVPAEMVRERPGQDAERSPRLLKAYAPAREAWRAVHGTAVFVDIRHADSADRESRSENRSRARRKYPARS